MPVRGGGAAAARSATLRHAPITIYVVVYMVDLLRPLFEALDLADVAAASVCKEWAAAWTPRVKPFLRQVPLPEISFDMGQPLELAALPGGDHLFMLMIHVEMLTLMKMMTIYMSGTMSSASAIGV